MDVALASLDRGVRVLFTDSTGVVAASSSHPLCECILQQAPPPDWRYLQRFPVLKRHVLAEFRSVAIEMAKTPQTPRKRKKRSVVQQIGDVDEYKALCLASLCQKLAQCELLTVGEAELMETLVKLESLGVLRRVIGGKLLPVRLRMLLLCFTLREQETKCQETMVQSWIQEVCEKILEEVLEATATGGSSEPPIKRARTRSGDKSTKGGDEEEKCCEFCRDGASAESLRSKFGGWDFLVECTQQIANVLEKAGESYASNQAMVALSAFWESFPVAGLATKVKTGRRRKRTEISVTNEEGVEPSISVATYERICKSDVVWSGIGELESKTNAFRKMWMNVWEREFKNMVKAKRITLADAIRHCSKADAFAGIILETEMEGRTSHLPGFRVVMEVIHSLFVGVSGVITAFAHAWNAAGAGCNGGFSHIVISSSTGPSSTKRIFQSYLSELLESPSIRHDVEPPSMDKTPALSTSSPLELLYFLYEMFSESITGGQPNGSYSRYWDVLMTQLDSATSMKEFPQDGMTWWLFLEKCLLNFDAKETMVMSYRDHFLQAFKCYCCAIVHRVLSTGGEIISSEGTIHRRLVKVESDRSAVRQVLAQMMITFGENWISDLIVQLLRTSTSETNQRGVKNLLFPALVSCMKSTSKFNPKKRTSGQQQFTDIVHVVSTTLKEREPTPLYLVSVMRFCEAWDVYQSTHTKEPPTRANRWGFRAMVELDMLPELLKCYERDDVVRHETSESLVFAAEVLQNAPNCPQTLETSLYKVISVVKAGSEQSKTIASGSLEAIDGQLISHSSDVLQRLLRAVKFADLAQTRQLMAQIKNAVGTLNELRQQLERWFSFVEMHGTAFAGKESRLELSLLCTRLIRWFPDEFERLRYLVMTPLDSHLVFALKAFVKEAGRPNNTERQSLVNSTTRSALPAAIRVEMALHLYLSAAAFPDLETLTILLTKAVVKCRSPDAFDHLAKVAQKNGRMLLPEAVVATLSSPLRGLFFSVSALTQPDKEVDDDEQIKNHARHAKSIIYQKNTLKLLAVSATIFEGGISWSTVLFDEKTAVTWLPHFFEYILKTEFGEGALRVDLLLTNLEELTQKAGLNEKALREAYWLAALLNTALVACSSRSAGAYADVEEGIQGRVRSITGKVLQLLSIASDTTTTQMSDDTVQHDGEILGLPEMSKCTRLVIEQNGAYWTRERIFGEKIAGALRLSVSDVWNAEMGEPHSIAVEPSFQLFVPFSHWLSGALVYSQSFLEGQSPTMRRWERTFTSYVTDLYLHLEFEDVTCNLLKAWLTTWVSSNIVRGQEELPLLALLPSQVALFRRLALTPYRGSSPERTRNATSLWQLIFVAINLVLDYHTTENTMVFEQATELVVSTLTTLELVELSASSDFVHFSHVQEIDPFFEELDKFLSRPQLRICSADQVCCLLQYPLELLVCCYACKVPATFESESQQFLQRVKKVLQGNFSAANTAENSADQQQCAVSSTEMDAFSQYWADEMLLKYDYVDRDRCVNILEIIQSALRGGNDEQ